MISKNYISPPIRKAAGYERGRKSIVKLVEGGADKVGEGVAGAVDYFGLWCCDDHDEVKGRRVGHFWLLSFGDAD